jgi:hypothetical protein
MDTISIVLKKEQVPNVDLLVETPQYLTSVATEGISFGKPTINGKLNSFNVTITEDKIKIRDASLTKYLFGNSLTTMSRSGIKQAFEKMSDVLHLPIKQAEVLKFHYAKNIMLNNDVSLYLPYLGQIKHFNRLEQPFGINYKQLNKEFLIYDKIREAKHHREALHPMYKDRFMIRLESRYERQICKQFNRCSISANMLYDEVFYMQVNDNWHNDYLSIDKLKVNKIDMKQITTKRQMALLGVLSLVQSEGGKTQALQNLKERYLKKELTKKQHHDLKAMIEQSSQMKLQTIESDLIIELNQKVKEAVKYYI